MTSKFSASITVDASHRNKAVFESINVDNRHYPENPTKTTMSLSHVITIKMQSDQISHLRAGLNSLLRLILASSDSIESAAGASSPDGKKRTA